jgi:hypothetical protein
VALGHPCSRLKFHIDLTSETRASSVSRTRNNIPDSWHSWGPTVSRMTKQRQGYKVVRSSGGFRGQQEAYQAHVRVESAPWENLQVEVKKLAHHENENAWTFTLLGIKSGHIATPPYYMHSKVPRQSPNKNKGESLQLLFERRILPMVVYGQRSDSQPGSTQTSSRKLCSVCPF